MTGILIPLPLAAAVCFVLAVMLVAQLPLSRFTGRPAPLEQLQEKLGLARLNAGLFLLLALFWLVLFGLLFGGLVKLIWTIITDPAPTEDTLWDWRFALAKLTALTGVLAAVVALPFTLIRLALNIKQRDHDAESLYNDKMNTAVADLYSQRQVTDWFEDEAGRKWAENGWQDDIPRRNGAIDRLKGLADENPDLRPRVDRLLSVYLRELSREYPPVEPPKHATPAALKRWAYELEPARSDMENAAQTLTKLDRPAWQEGEPRLPDLKGMNLQRFDLRKMSLANADLGEAQLQWADLREAQLQGADLGEAQLQGANLRWAKLQGANLRWAQLQGADLGDAQLQGANLRWAKLQGANLRWAKLQGVNLFAARLQGANLFGAKFDSSTSFRAAMPARAALKEVDLTEVPQITEHLNVMFGDRSVILPGGPDNQDYPDHWAEDNLDLGDFRDQWRAWQRAGGFDPDNPQ